jgi:outer membrane protein assembly factor BamB
MKTSKNKISAILITIVFIISMTSAATMIPNTSAHTPQWNIPTYAYLNVAPNPVGVGQPVIVVFWLNQIAPTAAGVAGMRFQNYTVTITAPDGTNTTQGPITADPISSGYITFTPAATGNYTFQFSFPGQIATLAGPTGLNGTSSLYVGDYYEPSISNAITLNVQSTPITLPPVYPLPIDYWQRPIEGQNSNWYTIASNWLVGSLVSNHFQPSGIAPNSPHVVWTKPIQFGGLVGSPNAIDPAMTYYTGSYYELKAAAPIIINGFLYEALPLSNNPTGGGEVCLDLQTGQQIWWQNITISFGQLYDYESLNQHGTINNGYLWATSGTTWSAYDPMTGAWLFNETNVPTGGTIAIGPNGEIDKYFVGTNGQYLQMWNNTAALALTASTGPTDTTSANALEWRPVGKVVSMSTAYSWNISIPTLPSGSTVVAVTPNLVLGRSGTLPGIGSSAPFTMWAISLQTNNFGTLLWQQSYNPPANNETQTQGPIDPNAGVFIMNLKETGQWIGYSLTNGSKLWGPTASEGPWAYYSDTTQYGGLITYQCAYGNFYSTGYQGVVYCYDSATGQLKWTYGNGEAGNSTNSGLATAYGHYTLGIGSIADGKIYLFSSEHSFNNPMYPGMLIRCIDANTGQELWTMDGQGGGGSGGIGGSFAVADGYLVYLNGYDGQLYCIGKGQTATTLTATPEILQQGSPIMIQGTVTDQSPGVTTQTKAISPDSLGSPAISDENMGSWMDYTYMQKPKPTNATGVPVTLTALDPNGNIDFIGNVTSDAMGSYSMAWTPPVPGAYTITATFGGTNSYFDSNTETHIEVSAAAPTATPSPAAQAPMTDTYIAYSAVGIIVTIIVVAIVLALLILKKRA